jgi:electron transfer flavoprotein alpha subunit
VLAGAAQRLGGRIDTHVTGIAAADGKPGVTRWYYRQRMEAVVQRTRAPGSSCSIPAAASAWSGAAGTAKVELVAVALTDANQAHDRHGRPGAARRPADHPPRCQAALRRRRRLDQDAADGKAHPEEAEQLILGFLAKPRRRSAAPSRWST